MDTLKKITLLGHVTDKPCHKTTAKGVSITTMTIATHTFCKNTAGQWISTKKYHKIITRGKLADYCLSEARKDVLSLIEGTVQYQQITDKDGSVKEKQEIIANKIKFLVTGRNRNAANRKIQ